MANASSSLGNSSILKNNNDEIKQSLEFTEEEPEQNNDELKIMIKSAEENYDDCQQNSDEFKIMIKSVEEKLSKISWWESCYYIARVPRWLREQKPEAYTPQSVSIGPLHHFDEHLWIKETHKLEYVNRLLIRSGKTFEFCVKAVSDLEEEARRCYTDTMGLGKIEFVKMIVIDSCFILEFLEGNRRYRSDHRKNRHDRLVPSDSWLYAISIDLLMVENQLPLSPLARLFDLLVHPLVGLPFNWYIYDALFFSYGIDLHCPVPDDLEALESSQKEMGGVGGPKHILDFLRCILIPRSVDLKNKKGAHKNFLRYLTASELQKAGVRFRSKEGNISNLFDMEFDMRNGVLTIPYVIVLPWTEIILRNLVALEQGKPFASRDFTAYATFMNSLIDNAKDVTLLMQKNIIINELGSPEDVVTLFNNVGQFVFGGSDHFNLILEAMLSYYETPYNTRMANLKQTYFYSPWAGISVVAAGFIIIFTLIQTICSLLQL